MKSKQVSLVIIGICLAIGTVASAESVTLKPSADTGLSAFNAANNFGRTDSLILGGIRQSPTASRILLRFTPMPGSVEIRFSAPAGNLYTLQSRQNLSGGTWTSITNISAKFTSLEPVILSPTGNEQFLFYRVLIQQID